MFLQFEIFQRKISNPLSLVMVALLFFAASCAKHTIPKPINSYGVKSSGNVKDDAVSRNIEKHIRDEYLRWKGTQHSLGGTDQNGIDCSAFVQAVYKKVFNIALPRTTKEQVKEGRYIGRNELKAGDLVFFKPPTYPRHVGIFLSGNEFVHASKSKGVIVSKIDPYYWGKCSWTGRRVLSSE